MGTEWTFEFGSVNLVRAKGRDDAASYTQLERRRLKHAFSEYEIVEWLGAGAESRLARGIDSGESADGDGVFLEVLEGSATPEARARLQRQYELSLSLAHCPGVLRPIALDIDGPRPALALEGKRGQLLESALASPIDRARALRLALRLAQLVEGLHEARVIHRDLRPQSLLLDTDDQLWFLGLARAGRWGEPDLTASSAGLPSADPAYISPEQTGRMKRAVDFHSDLYSVGVILYRLFSGELPFRAKDALEWVHAHLARTPPPLDDPALSAIVLRLLEKAPEDRYQSARGLALDLRRYLEAWTQDARVVPFAPGRDDVPPGFQSPRQLYGRQSESEALLAIWQRVSRGANELALIAGYSGVGKSSLVHGLRRTIAAGSAFFIVGKFDPFRGTVPYSTLAVAFRELVLEILAGSEEQIGAWRRRLRGALGSNGQIVVDVIPALELVIGPQPAAPVLSPTEAQNRFRSAFVSFVVAVAQPDRPLVVFLDDLQWADAASLELTRALLVEGAVRHVLVLGAYRDNELGPAHPLHDLCAELSRAGAAMTRITLTPLPPAALAAVIADGLSARMADSSELTAIVHAKTAGNPFFAIQFLIELCDEQLISFDTTLGGFRCDLERIAAKELADNVIELLIAKLRRLPRATQVVLELLATLALEAEITLLALLAAVTEAELNAALQQAAQVGLIVRTNGGCAFVHDRVREAAYALIPEAERPRAHLRIARRWAASLSAALREQHIFDLVGHWNRGAELLVEPSERATLSRLNVLAGTKAKAAVAYASARAYLAQAAALLPVDAWQASYDDMLTLQLELAECEYLVGAYARADELLDLALARTRSVLDGARVQRLRVRLYQLAGRHPDAVTALLAGLTQLGLTFPAGDAELERASAAELVKIASLVRGRRIADFVEAPEAPDAGVRATIGLIDEGLAPAYVSRAALWLALALRITSLSLEHGHAEGSAFGYIAYAVVLGATTDDRPTALAFSEMALRLDERRDARSKLKGKLLFHHASMVNHWCRHFATSLRQLNEAFPACLAVGELVYAGYMTYNRVWLLIESGASLERASAAARDDLALAQKWHNELVSQVLRAELQFIASLQGQTRAPASFDDESFVEAGCISTLERAAFKVGLAFVHVMKQCAAVVYGRFTEARDSAARAAECLRGVTGLPIESAYWFYHALTLAALHADAPAAEREPMARALGDLLARHERWAEYGPENFGHRRALIAAEVARIEGRTSDAERSYQEAIAAAAEHGFVHAEALAWEVASRFYRARGLAAIADACVRAARAAYARWGAVGKVEALDAAFPRLAPEPSGAGARGENLDLSAAFQASQAISRQIELADLLQVIMRVVLESAGAQAGWLVLVRAGRLSLAAHASAGEQGIRLDSVGDAPLPVDLPLSILNCVRRTGERVLLDDATQPGPFAADPVLAARHSKSVLCLPILHQSELIALLHLENRLVTSAFTGDRLAVLELLAAQAAISLENARLYADARRENAERRQAEAALRDNQALLQAIVDHAPALIYVKDLDGRYLLVNRQLAAGLGREPAAILGKSDRELLPRELADASRALDERAAAGAVVEAEEVGYDSSRTYLAVKAPLSDDSARIYATCGISTDITERKRADATLRRTEEQLRQAQKMEAIGNLAGGVAHDFNNLLSVILGYGSLLMDDLTLGDPRRGDIDEIIRAANAAAELTHQLLAFGRKQILQPRLVSLNESVTRMEKMLRRLIGEDIELTVNSRDAMPGGGKLTIETANVELDEKCVADHAGVAVGSHVMLAVSDTGVGMDQAIQERMFEPFFTTKEKGKGTGLGLSTVFGIVRQSGGHIWVYSELGVGATFKVYFPRVQGTVTEAALRPSIAAVRGGSETILLVEDDERVRTVASTILRRLGYYVLEAPSVGDTLLLLEQHPETIHLLLTDVIMPRMSGRQLAERLLRVRPAMRVLYMSGYTDNSIVHHGVLDAGVEFLEKPVTPEKLARKVREVLDAD
jgi:PAS domain S-box-containing protein